MLSKQELRGPFRNILELLLASYTGLDMHASAKEIQTVSMMGGGEESCFPRSPNPPYLQCYLEYTVGSHKIYLKYRKSQHM